MPSLFSSLIFIYKSESSSLISNRPSSFPINLFSSSLSFSIFVQDLFVSFIASFPLFLVDGLSSSLSAAFRGNEENQQRVLGFCLGGDLAQSANRNFKKVERVYELGEAVQFLKNPANTTYTGSKVLMFPKPRLVGAVA